MLRKVNFESKVDYFVRYFAQGGWAIKGGSVEPDCLGKEALENEMLESDELLEAKELEMANIWAQLAAIQTQGENGAVQNVAPTETMNIMASTPESQQRDIDSCLSSPKLQENSLLSNSWKG